jgi:hypothetical protein
VIERLLPEDLFQQHFARAQGTGRLVDLRHDSSLSANADPIGFLLWWGWRNNARRRNPVPPVPEQNFFDFAELENRQ